MSRSRGLLWVLVVAVVVVVAGGTGGAARAARQTQAGRAQSAPGVLVERLRASGRGEVGLERKVSDPFTGKPDIVRGRLTLEPPDRVALEFFGTGERVTMRADGGEWVQPQLRQMVRLGPERAAAARLWWEILIAEPDGRVDFRRLGPRAFLILVREPQASSPDSAWMWLDRAGLPTRLEINEEPGSRTVYRLTGWRFARPRGRAAFVLEAPAGYEVVTLR